MNINDPFDLHIQALNNNTFLKAKNVKIGTTQGNVLHGKNWGFTAVTAASRRFFFSMAFQSNWSTKPPLMNSPMHGRRKSCNLSQSLETKEGFAQWVAAQVLKLKALTGH